MTTLLLVDDHPIVRRGLAELLLNMPEIDAINQASDSAQTLASFRRTRPDAVILDLTLGNESGIEILKKLLAIDPDVPVMILSMHDESLHAERALMAGARGYVMKHEATDTLIDAVRRLLKNELVFSTNVQHQVLTQLSKRSTPGANSGVSSLTERESEILELIGNGLSTVQIAEKLSRSVKTIEAHRASIRNKLGLNSSFELVRFALHWLAE